MDHITDTPLQPGEEEQCPDGLMDAVRATFRMGKRIEQAVVGKPFDPINYPGLLREVAALKNDLKAHIEACPQRPAKKLPTNKVLLGGLAAGTIAIFSTLGHFIGKGLTVAMAVIFGGGAPPTSSAH